MPRPFSASFPRGRRLPVPLLPLLPLLLVPLLGGCDPQLGVDPAWADVPLPSAERPVDPVMADVGAELFRRNCVACHSLGGGNLVGPDLKGVTERRPQAWIRGMVARPDSMLRVDGVAQALLVEYQVPMLNRELDQARVRAIMEFLWRADHAPSQGEASPADAPQAEASPPVP